MVSRIACSTELIEASVTCVTYTLIILCERLIATGSGQPLRTGFRFVAWRFRLNAHTYRLLIFKERCCLAVSTEAELCRFFFVLSSGDRLSVFTACRTAGSGVAWAGFAETRDAFRGACPAVRRSARRHRVVSRSRASDYSSGIRATQAQFADARQRCLNSGVRLARNARIPSFWSSVAKSEWNWRRSNSRPSDSGAS